MDLIVRRAEPGDLAELIRIWNEVVEAGRAFPQTQPLDMETGRAFFDSQSWCAVADCDDEIVGLYILHPNNVGRCGHIGNASYAVDSRKRGLHVGEALVRDCIARAGKVGFRVLQFNAVVVSNARALRLYKKLGFQQLGVIPGGFLNKDGVYEDIIPHYITL
ncbi:MAG: GNAT family N-acetyltransferase [Oscillospiraceae bacterium]|nr:GNAT family N-acetyltransferase [Oscillospiraceae bacterium]